MALFEQQGGTYQKKGDYFIPCVVTKKKEGSAYRGMGKPSSTVS